MVARKNDAEKQCEVLDISSDYSFNLEKFIQDECIVECNPDEVL